MKTKDFAALGRELLRSLPGYSVRGKLILATPHEPILRGIAFDGSSNDKKAFYINVFFQPLCVPAELVHFTLGFRLRDMDGRDGWQSTNPNMVAELAKAIHAHALPFLEGAATFEGAAKAAEAMHSTNSHLQEAAAYCRMLAGDCAMALSQLQAITFNRDIGWQNQQAIRIEGVMELLRNDPVAAVERLRLWQSETAFRLGFPALSAG